MAQAIRELLASDVFVALLAIAATVSAVVSWRLWRSPNSWHIDGETKKLRFHAWLEILIAMAGVFTFAILVVLTI